MRADAEPWWRQAVADLDAAERNLRIRLYFVTSWYAQQAVEKALKARYVDRTGTMPPRTHDLEFLDRAASVSPELAVDLAELNPRFDAVRYPDSAFGIAPVDAISRADAISDLELARRVISWVRR